MKKILITTAAIVATFGYSSISAQAQDQPSRPISKHEVGIGLSLGEAGLANLRYGYNINKNFRVEVEASSGEAIFNGDNIIFSDDEIDYWVTAFGVLRAPYGQNNSALFVRAGAGISKVTAPGFTSQTPLFGPNDTTYPDLEAKGTVFQVGGGLEHFFSRGFGLRAEGIYANDSAFDEVTETIGRQPRETGYAMGSISAVVRF